MSPDKDPDKTPKPDPKPLDVPIESADPGTKKLKKSEPGPKSESDATVSPTDPIRGRNAGFETLLKNPRDIIQKLNDDPGFHLTLKLAATAFVCLLGFGFVVGTMSGGHQLWAAPLKVAGGVLVSALICLPSLYIFACLTGLDLRPGTVGGILAAVVCLAALLLVGFTPVAWLFAQSTDSTFFYGLLCLAFWGIALYFGFGLIRQAAELFSITKRHHLVVWSAIFALVTIQMSTSLRPIIGTAQTFFPEEKRSFLEHWFSQVKTTGWRTAEKKDISATPVAKKSDGWE